MIDEVVFESSHSQKYAPSSAKAIIPIQVDSELEHELAAIPDKMAFKIGEVADLVGVKPYVLRYWETEFETLKPKKSKHNQRMYERRDVESLIFIKKLLYRDRFSIEGAKQALKKLRKDNVRVKQIKTIAECVEEAKDRAFDMLEQIRTLKALFR